MIKTKTILLVGGGTGGHIVPVLNLRRELYKQGGDLNIYTVGGNSAIDHRLFCGLRNHFVLITGKFHRSITIENIIQLFLLLWGLVSSIRILRTTKPDLIFSKAGYVSLPIILWSKILKIPYFIHESDIEMGASNKFASSSAARIFVGFPTEYYSKLIRNKLKYTGQMIPSDFADLQNTKFDFGFENNKPIIFITGGSQGANKINKAIFQIVPKLLLDYNVIHHTGSVDFEKAMQLRSELPIKYRNHYFISRLLTKKSGGVDMMKSAITQSDLIISRASATTLSEISVMKKPIIAIPYKYAAANHQAKNAAYYKRHGAIEVIIDDKLTGKSLMRLIINLFSHPTIMKEMGKKAYDLQILDGLSTITEEINRYLNIGKYEEI